MAEDIAAQDASKKEASFVKYWVGQLDSYWEEYKDWEKRCDKIIQRYRDDRAFKANGEAVGGARFNALWSNIQTLLPAVYIKPPKPIAERRYLDKDPLARLASMTLERSLEVTIQECGYHSATKRAVMDYLLCARGVEWHRYEPTYGTPEDLGPTAADDESTKEAADDDGEQPEAPRPVTWEKVYADYVNFKNFRHSPSPTWEEVSWVAKREFLTRRELRTRFKKKDEQSGKPIAELVPLQSDYEQSAKDQRDNRDGRPKSKNKTQRAEVWEIWDKTTRKVIFIATGWEQCALEVTDDPLHLQEFWPCQKPIYGTLTNDTLIPVPDYIEYQDQAEELDNLTSRISALTDAIRVNGVYDASYPALKRILQEGSDNRMIGIANYAEFASKGGLESAVDFVPIKDVVEALIRLYEARDRTKADMAEITGLSDIVRGQAQGAAKTATEQRIKGQFASLRLEDRKAEVARFCRDGVAIIAEVIAEQFSPEIIAQMTGMIALITEEVKTDPKLQAAVPPVPVGAPGAPGAPPQGTGPQPMQPDPAQMAQQIFDQCIKLLRDDKMRTFRIDIETDSTVAVDKQAEKESVVELFTAIGGFLEKAMIIGQQMPKLAAPLGQSLLFAFRRFGVGRDVEAIWEQAIDEMAQDAKNPQPKPPSPEEIKAKAEMDKANMENQRMQQQAQIDQQKGQQDLQIAQAKNDMDMQKMQAELEVKRQELALDQQRLALEERQLHMKAQIEERTASIKADALERSSQLDGQNAERKHELSMEVMEAKAAQAKKPKAGAMA